MGDAILWSRDLMEEVVEASTGPAPVDFDRPGFSSLATLVQCVRQGLAGDRELACYREALAWRVGQSLLLLEQLDLPPVVRELAGPALSTARELLGRMQQALGCLDAYLATHEPECLEETEELLAWLGDGIAEAMNGLEADSLPAAA